jgi:hypothetical protein
VTSSRNKGGVVTLAPFETAATEVLVGVRVTDHGLGG